MADQYIKAKIMLPRGDEIERGHVVTKVMMPMDMFWVEPIQILFLILGCIK